jgi:integrase
MPIQSKFTIKKITYPNGSETYRVAGRIEGKQIRKHFKTRKAAVEEKQRLEIRRVEGDTDGQTIFTTLTRDQNRDAIAAVNRLKAAKSKKTLSFAVDFLLKHYSEAGEEMVLKDATRLYEDHKSLEETRGIISGRQYKSIRYEMRGLKAYFGEDQMLDEITGEQLEKYINAPRTGNNRSAGFSMKTWNNRRGLLSTFFKYSYEKKWVGRNPVEDVRIFKVKHRRSTAETLTAEQAADMMKFLETYAGPKYKKSPLGPRYPGFMVPYFALSLFAGIRPDNRDGEISKLRPKDIDLDQGVIRIEPEVSKVNERRIVKIQPNLRAWLEKYPLPETGAVPIGDAGRIVLEVRQKFDLGHDVLRHTFISMLVAAFRSVGEASLQAGNSEAVVRRHYLDLKTVKEADQFWRIMPEGMALPENLEKKDGVYVEVEEVKKAS